MFNINLSITFRNFALPFHLIFRTIGRELPTVDPAGSGDTPNPRDRDAGRWHTGAGQYDVPITD